MSETKLLNCPFCGGEAEIVVGKFEYERSPGVKYDYTARCKECASESDLFYSEEEAINAWNTRKLMERIVERLEAEKTEYERSGREFTSFVVDDCLQIVKEEGGLND